MPDRLSVTDLELWLRIGVTEEERRNPQRVLVSFTMDYDSKVVADTDVLAPAMDYGRLAENVTQRCEALEVRTIERLAQVIADVVLEASETEKVTVLVKKFPLPAAREVSLEITRER